MLLLGSVIFGGTLLASKKAYDTLKKSTNYSTTFNRLVSNVSGKKTTTINESDVKQNIPSQGNTNLHPSPEDATELAPKGINNIEDWFGREFALTTIALGAAIAGTLFYAPLILLSIAGLSILSLPLIRMSYDSLVRKRRVDVIVVELVSLMGLLLTGHIVAAAVCYWIVYLMLGMSNRAKGRTMEKLVNICGEQPRSAWVLKGDCEIQIPVEELRIGDVVVVHAGEMIPVDGIILKGVAGVDQRMLTGESQPAEKNIGDSVFAATMVLSGQLSIQMEKTGSETVAAEIGQILNETSSYASTIELRSVDMANRWALPSLIVSGLAYPVAGTVGSLAALWVPFDDALYLASPLSLLNHLYLASQRGLLIKNGRALELIQQVDTIVFDKTGTLTEEQPHVGKIYTFDQHSADDLLRYAAAAEDKQTHPIALAILNAARERYLDVPDIDEAAYEVGYGVKVHVGDQKIQVGSNRFMDLEGVLMPDAIETVQTDCYDQGITLIYIAIDNQLAGAIELHATLRPETEEVMQELKKRNYTLYIISGDHEKPTQSLARKLGIDHYFAETLPENKADIVEELQSTGKSVCFIGDGINDAIALKTAKVSVSLSGASTAATDTAQVVLMNSNLNQLVDLLDISKDLQSNTKNIVWLGATPSIMLIGGVFFLHFRILVAMGFYLTGMTFSVVNAMGPLIKYWSQRLLNSKDIEDTKSLPGNND